MTGRCNGASDFRPNVTSGICVTGQHDNALTVVYFVDGTWKCETCIIANEQTVTCAQVCCCQEPATVLQTRNLHSPDLYAACGQHAAYHPAAVWSGSFFQHATL